MIFIYFHINGLTKPYGANRYYWGEDYVGSLSYNAFSAVMMHLVVNIDSLSPVTIH